MWVAGAVGADACDVSCDCSVQYCDCVATASWRFYYLGLCESYGFAVEVGDILPVKALGVVGSATDVAATALRSFRLD